MSLVSICSRCGHEGLLCKFSAAFISVAIVAVTVVAFPWPAPSADAATSDLSAPLGENSAQISYVRNTEGSDTVTDLAGGYYYSALPWQWVATRACIRYSPAGGDYSTSVVKGSSGAYATVGYGCQELNGSFNVRAAGTIEANFPWVEKDTINTCTGKIDSDGRLIVGDYGKEEDRVPTSYAYDSKGNVGHYGGNCIYMYQNNRLVRFDGYMTQNYTARTGAAARTTSSISSPTARTPPGPTRVPASGTS